MVTWVTSDMHVEGDTSERIALNIDGICGNLLTQTAVIAMVERNGSQWRSSLLTSCWIRSLSKKGHESVRWEGVGQVENSSPLSECVCPAIVRRGTSDNM